MKDRANIGIGGAIAIVIVATFLLGAFVVPYFLSLVDTTPPREGALGMTLGIPGRDEHFATAGVYINVNEPIDIDESSILLSFQYDVGQSEKCSITTTIREAGPTFTGITHVHFDAMDIYGEMGYRLRFSTRTVGDGHLESARYWYVIDLQCGATVDASWIRWEAGQTNHGSSGNVEKGGVYRYHQDDGLLHQWIGPGEMGLNSYIYLEMTGGITANDTEDIELIDTTTNGEEPKADATVIFIVGILFLILGLAMMAVGTKAGPILLIIGLIFVIFAVMVLAYASFVILTYTSIGASLAIKRYQEIKEVKS